MPCYISNCGSYENLVGNSYPLLLCHSRTHGYGTNSSFLELCPLHKKKHAGISCVLFQINYYLANTKLPCVFEPPNAVRHRYHVLIACPSDQPVL